MILRRLLRPDRLPAIAAALVAGVGLAYAALKLSPLMALGAVLGLAVFGVLVANPTLGLLLTALLVPIERVGRFTNDSAMYTVSLMRIAGLLALGALFLNRFLKRKGFIFGTPLVIYGIFVAFSVLSITYSNDVVKSVQMSSTFVGNLLFFFLIVNLTRNHRAIKLATYAWLVASILSGVYATYDWHFGSGETGGFTVAANEDPGHGRNTDERMSAVWEDRGELDELSDLSVRRSMGTTSHAAVFGINLILSLPFFIYAIRVSRSIWTQGLLVVGAAFIAYNIFLTNTRSVTLTLGVVGLLCLVRGLVRLTGPVIAGGVAAAAIVLLVVPVDTYNRSLDWTNYTVSHSATLRIRFQYWQAGIAMIRDHWLTGLGSGNENAMAPYVNLDGTVQSNLHNEFLQTLMEVGVIQGLTFFVFVGLILRQAFKAASIFKRLPGGLDEYYYLVACQCAMLGVLFYGVQVDVFHFPLKGWWLIAGFVYVLSTAASRLQRAPRTLAPAPGDRPLEKVA